MPHLAVNDLLTPMDASHNGGKLNTKTGGRKSHHRPAWRFSIMALLCRHFSEHLAFHEKRGTHFTIWETPRKSQRISLWKRTWYPNIKLWMNSTVTAVVSLFPSNFLLYPFLPPPMNLQGALLGCLTKQNRAFFFPNLQTCFRTCPMLGVAQLDLIYLSIQELPIKLTFIFFHFINRLLHRSTPNRNKWCYSSKQTQTHIILSGTGKMCYLLGTIKRFLVYTNRNPVLQLI